MKHKSFRFTDAEWSSIEEAASSAGVTPYEFARRLFMAFAAKNPPSGVSRATPPPVAWNRVHKTDQRTWPKYTIKLDPQLAPALDRYAARNGYHGQRDRAILSACRATLFHRGDLYNDTNGDRYTSPDDDTSAEFSVPFKPQRPMPDDRGGEP